MPYVVGIYTITNRLCAHIQYSPICDEDPMTWNVIYEGWVLKHGASTN